MQWVFCNILHPLGLHRKVTPSAEKTLYHFSFPVLCIHFALVDSVDSSFQENPYREGDMKGGVDRIIWGKRSWEGQRTKEKSDQ